MRAGRRVGGATRHDAGALYKTLHEAPGRYARMDTEIAAPTTWPWQRLRQMMDAEGATTGVRCFVATTEP